MTEHLLTPKQTTILIYLSRFRFLNRIQLQHLINHKNSTRINPWLKDLTANDYIGRIYSTNFGENTKPALYYLKLKGIQQLRAEHHITGTYVRTLYRDAERSEKFKNHCSLVADIYLEVSEQKHHGHIEEFPLYEALTAPELISSPLSTLNSLHPDLVLIKKKEEETTYHVVSILDDHIPPNQLRSKLKSFAQFYFSGDWEEQTEADFPILLVVCPTTPFLITAKRMARKILEQSQDPEDLVFRFALQDDVLKEGLTSKIWEVLR